jgi:AcrR family transcriptional regulator
MKEKDVQKRILKAALKEFSFNGFNGARMDRIARAANVNKAMLHYYFASKKNLYQLVVKEVFLVMSPRIMELVNSDPGPEEFIEGLAHFYGDLNIKNPDFVRMIVLELVQNPKNIQAIITELFISTGLEGPPRILKLISKWQEEGKVTEEDPFHFILNLISLSLFSFLGKPIMEGVFRLTSIDTSNKKEFKEKRVQSVIHIAKHGMLK